jgi:hypothetical protein
VLAGKRAVAWSREFRIKPTESTMSKRKLNKLPLLRSESTAEYATLMTKLQEEIRPSGPIETIYLEDIAALIWEIQRLRHFRISIIQKELPQAMQDVLQQLLFKPDILEQMAGEEEASRLSRGWLDNDPEDRQAVQDLLHRFGLDEAAFEAEAMRSCADQLEYFDRALSAARARLDKALRLIMEYREAFASQLRRRADQLLQEGETAVPVCIEHEVSVVADDVEPNADAQPADDADMAETTAAA